MLHLFESEHRAPAVEDVILAALSFWRRVCCCSNNNNFYYIIIIIFALVIINIKLIGEVEDK